MRRGLGILRGAAMATVLVAPAAALPGSQQADAGPGYEASQIDLELELIAVRKALVEDYESEPWNVDWAEVLGDDDLADLDLTDLDLDDLDLDGGTRFGEPSPVADSLSSSGIPEIALDAYGRAEASTALTDPRCGLRWSLVAAIGRVESDHGRHGGSQLQPDGTARPPIIGIPLDGQGDVALIRDTDGGTLDNDADYDRAVGPMQFIPTTWKMMAVDGNGDGVEDPHNIYDAALAAAHYLCSGDVDLRETDQLQAAVYRYNRSDEYVNLVLSLAAAYERGEHDAPVDDPGPGTTSQPTDPADVAPVDIPASVGVPPGVQESPSDATGRAAPPFRAPPATPLAPTAPPASPPDTPSPTAPSRPSAPPATSPDIPRPPATDPPPRPSTTTTTAPPAPPTTTAPTTTTPPSTTTPPTTQPPTTTAPPTTSPPTTGPTDTTTPPTTGPTDTTVPDEPDAAEEPVCPDGFELLPEPDDAESPEGDDEEAPVCCAADESGELPASADEDQATCCTVPDPEAPVTSDDATDDEEADIPECCTLAEEDDTVPATAEDGTPLCPELVSAVDSSHSGGSRADITVFFALVAFALLALLALLPPTLLTYRRPTRR